MWMNKYGKNDYQGSHFHPGNFSFIIYYKTEKSYTVFNSPDTEATEEDISAFEAEIPVAKEPDKELVAVLVNVLAFDSAVLAAFCANVSNDPVAVITFFALILRSLCLVFSFLCSIGK